MKKVIYWLMGEKAGLTWEQMIAEDEIACRLQMLEGSSPRKIAEGEN